MKKANPWLLLAVVVLVLAAIYAMYKPRIDAALRASGINAGREVSASAVEIAAAKRGQSSFSNPNGITLDGWKNKSS